MSQEIPNEDNEDYTYVSCSPQLVMLKKPQKVNGLKQEKIYWLDSNYDKKQQLRKELQKRFEGIEGIRRVQQLQKIQKQNDDQTFIVICTDLQILNQFLNNLQNGIINSIQFVYYLQDERKKKFQSKYSKFMYASNIKFLQKLIKTEKKNFAIVTLKNDQQQILIQKYTVRAMLNIEKYSKNWVQLRNLMVQQYLQLVKFNFPKQKQWMEDKLKNIQKSIKQNQSNPQKIYEQLIELYTEQTCFFPLLNNLLRLPSQPCVSFYALPYVVPLYHAINFFFEQQKDKFKETIQQQQKKTMTFWRGTTFSDAEITKIKKMKEDKDKNNNNDKDKDTDTDKTQNKDKDIYLVNRGFFSTSKNKDTGQEFLNNTLLKINVKNVNNGFADITQFSKVKSEQEVLFNIHCCFKVISIQKDASNTNIIQLQYVNGDERFRFQSEQQKYIDQYQTIFQNINCQGVICRITKQYHQALKYCEKLKELIMKNASSEDSEAMGKVLDKQIKYLKQKIQINKNKSQQQTINQKQLQYQKIKQSQQNKKKEELQKQTIQRELIQIKKLLNQNKYKDYFIYIFKRFTYSQIDESIRFARQASKMFHQCINICQQPPKSQQNRLLQRQKVLFKILYYVLDYLTSEDENNQKLFDQMLIKIFKSVMQTNTEGIFVSDDIQPYISKMQIKQVRQNSFVLMIMNGIKQTIIIEVIQCMLNKINKNQYNYQTNNQTFYKQTSQEDRKYNLNYENKINKNQYNYQINGNNQYFIQMTNKFITILMNFAKQICKKVNPEILSALKKVTQLKTSALMNNQPKSSILKKFEQRIEKFTNFYKYSLAPHLTSYMKNIIQQAQM